MKLPPDLPLLDARPRNAHKGSMGRVLIIGGSVGLTGAVTLAANAALRAGAGLVTCAIPKSLNAIVEIKCTEPMSLPLAEGKAGGLCRASLAGIAEAIDVADAVVLGVGLGRSAETTAFVRELLPQLRVPHIVDADGLWHLAQIPDLLCAGTPARVLTPHAGEWQRLAKSVGIASTAPQAFVEEISGTLVEKGPQTRVWSLGRTFTGTTGNPGLATGGTGDVLAGVISALAARSKASSAQMADRVWNAAVQGVWLHGRAGDLGAERVGEESLIASDVITELPTAIREILKPRS